MIKVVIFDVGGTLIDTVDLHAQTWVETLEHFGVEVPLEDMRVQIGKGGDQILHGLIPPDLVKNRGDAAHRPSSTSAVSAEAFRSMDSTSQPRRAVFQPAILQTFDQPSRFRRSEPP